MKQEYRAFFSANGNELGGSSYYRRANDGVLVQLTAVYSSLEAGWNGYAWDDAVYLGIVNQYVGKSPDPNDKYALLYCEVEKSFRTYPIDNTIFSTGSLVYVRTRSTRENDRHLELPLVARKCVNFHLPVKRHDV